MTEASPAGTFILTNWHRETLCRMAFQGAPEEVCGFILRDGRIKKLRNIHPYPYKNFQLSPEELNRIDPKDVVAVWHSHPGGSLFPSKDDQQNMGQLGQAYGSWVYLIVTKDDVAQYNTEEVNWSRFT